MSGSPPPNGSLPSGSGPSSSIPTDGSEKLRKQIDATLRLQEVKGIKIFADIASKIVPYVRGSVCLICSGSSKANSNYWSGTGIYIKQDDFDAIIATIAESILKTKELASGCKNDAVLGLQNMNEQFNITCAISQD
jgi:hypothetical protein